MVVNGRSEIHDQGQNREICGIDSVGEKFLSAAGPVKSLSQGSMSNGQPKIPDRI
jgi:hypothetical protein